jgi:hypothetical protein
MGRLELENDGGGPRDFLEGKAVHAGADRELQLDNGNWIRGGYDWTYEGDSLPRFNLGLAVKPPGPAVDEGALLLPTYYRL